MKVLATGDHLTTWSIRASTSGFGASHSMSTLTRTSVKPTGFSLALSDQMLAAPLTVVGLGHEQSVPIF